MKLMLTSALFAGAVLLGACGDREVADVNAPAPDTTGTVATTPATPVSTVCSQYGLLDRNSDGVDRTDFTAFGDGVFADWDTNDDNRLDQTEFNQCWTAGGWSLTEYDNYDSAWTAWDRNDDNFLTEDEFFAEEGFNTWDADRNGVLVDEEWR